MKSHGICLDGVWPAWLQMGRIRARSVKRRRRWEVGRPVRPYQGPIRAGQLGGGAKSDWPAGPSPDWGGLPVGGEAGHGEGLWAVGRPAQPLI